ncbi:MAG: outer membrane beta-barrel protein [Alphaproteobacteria bacterium]|nr:outer membrane beta-barrel protein [Alphaproteobacteria bacterium]
MNKCVSSAKVLVFVSALGSVSVFADSNVGSEDLEGFFIGVDAAYSCASVEHDLSDSGYFDGNLRHPDDDLYTNKHKRVSFDPSINVGYLRGFGNWYAGLSADVSFGGNKKRTFDMDRSEGYSKIAGVSYMLKFKGGYHFKGINSLIYGIVGLKWRDADFGFNMRISEIQALVKSRTKAKLKSPLFVLGLGVERPIYKKISLSAEYEYAWRNSTGEARENYKMHGAYAYATAKQSLREHSVKVGLKYRF